MRWVSATIPNRLRAIEVRRLSRRLAGRKLIRAFGARFPAAVFIEIGANDGAQLDHLRSMILRYQWSGIMVEPVPYVFERLRSNYGALERVRLENVAIADQEGHRPFYYLSASDEHEREGLPEWYDSIGSFSREIVVDHRRLIPDIEKRLVEQDVPCLTFDSLCEKHGLSTLDLLVVDTEGYDLEILRQIDFSRYQPTLVVYEHYHLPRNDRQAARDLMRHSGYATIAEGFDTWCLRPDADERLRRLWRRLQPAVPELHAEDEPR